MINLHIKICGIRHPAAAQQAILAGANYIGIVFHPSSKRYVAPSHAKKIAAVVRQHGATPVAIFVNHSAADMLAICKKTQIQTVQLHGELAKAQHVILPAHWQRIYVLKVNSDGDVVDNLQHLSSCDPKRDLLLFDHQHSGQGKTFNWQNFSCTHDFKWLLGGGLNTNNLPIALRQLQPDGIDVSSGVENAAGEKDIALIKQFIATAQSVGRSHDE